MTRPAELRGIPEGELLERLDSAKEELFNLRFQMATGQLDNPMVIKQVRHEVARILTVLRERELAELEGRPLPEAAPVEAEEAEETEEELPEETASASPEDADENEDEEGS